MRRKRFLLTICFAFAIGIVLYPFIANLYNSWRSAQLAVEYEETLAALDDAALEEEYARAVAYNQSLSAADQTNFFEGMDADERYESVLNLSSDGIMATLLIPKIDVELSIYHYDTDEVLAKGVGHVQTTAVPVGGSGTHCVLTGHRGLPGSRLFTDLDQMEIGDRFYIQVLGHTLAYEVIRIETVLPTEVDSLSVVTGEDLVTLVTCTPYGVNTHRLLVTGRRTEYDDGAAEAALASEETDRSLLSPDYLLLYVAILELLLYLFLMHRLKAQEEEERRARQRRSAAFEEYEEDGEEY